MCYTDSKFNIMNKNLAVQVSTLENMGGENIILFLRPVYSTLPDFASITITKIFLSAFSSPDSGDPSWSAPPSLENGV